MSEQLYQAAKTNNADSIIKLARSGDDVNAYHTWIWSYLWAYTPLDIATSQGHTQAVSALLSLGADLNSKSGNLFSGWSTPISTVANNLVDKMSSYQATINKLPGASSHSQEMQHAQDSLDNDYAIFKLLIDHGANVQSIPNSFSSFSRGQSLTTLLKVAQSYNDTDIVQQILDICIDSSSDKMKFPIGLENLLADACDSPEVDAPIVQILVDHGANIYHQTGLLKTCVEQGAYSKAQVLLDKMLDTGLVDYRSIKNMIPKINFDNIQIQTEHEALTEHKTNLEKTISIIATQYERPMDWITQEYFNAKEALNAYEENMVKPFIKFTSILANELNISVFSNDNVIYIQDVIDMSPSHQSLPEIAVLSTQDVLHSNTIAHQSHNLSSPSLLLTNLLEHHENVVVPIS